MKEAGKIHVPRAWEQMKRPGIAGECFRSLDIPGLGLAEAEVSAVPALLTGVSSQCRERNHWELRGVTCFAEVASPHAADPWTHLVTVTPARLAAVG